MRIAHVAVLAVTAATALVTAGCSGPAAASPPEPASHAAKAGHGVRGTVTAENGTTWTVTTVKNRAVTVTITPQTVFGTKKAPSSADRFPVGSPVRIAGTGDAKNLTATRVGVPEARGSAPAAPSATTAPSTPAAPSATAGA